MPATYRSYGADALSSNALLKRLVQRTFKIDGEFDLWRNAIEIPTRFPSYG